MTKPDISFIADLEAIVRSRLDEGAVESYTARLAASGTRRIAQKVGEEGLETALAAVACDNGEVTEEAADLLYHLLVLLRAAGLSLEEVLSVLQSRHSTS